MIWHQTSYLAQIKFVRLHSWHGTSSKKDGRNRQSGVSAIKERHAAPPVHREDRTIRRFHGPAFQVVGYVEAHRVSAAVASSTTW